MMPPFDVEGVTPVPGKLKKHPGAGPFGHNEGLIIEFGLAYILLLFQRLKCFNCQKVLLEASRSNGEMVSL